jgi:hypothetical protein
MKLFTQITLISGILLLLYDNATAQFVNKSEYATIYVARDASKKITRPNTVFFNAVEVFSIKAGERVSYKIYSEGALTITLIQGKTYQKPSSKDANNQTLSIAKSQNYYFTADNEGKLIYVSSEEDGKKVFENKQFTNNPIFIEEDVNQPIPDMSIVRKAKEIKIKAEAEKKEVAEKQEQIKKEIDTFFEDLKKKSQLSTSVDPNINIEIKEGGFRDGRPTYNLIANYSYDVTEELHIELINYPSGAYMPNTSPAAKAISQAAKITIEKYLSEYLEEGSEVHIQIIGSADSRPITNDYPYKGEFSSFDAYPYYIADNYDLSAIGELYASTTATPDLAKQINYEHKSMAFKQGEMIKSNETLAFLRSYGIRHYMESNITKLSEVKTTFLHFARVAESTEAKHRKVSIQLLIEDIMRNK